MEDSVVYELGFHISPAVAEGDLEKVVEGIKAAIVAEKGNVFAEETPKLIPLAYQIMLKSDAGTSRFDKAYFGWVKFTLEAENVSKVNDFAKANKNIIRFILVKTDRANTTVFHKALIRKEEGEEKTGEVAPEEVDAKIEELVV